MYNSIGRRVIAVFSALLIAMFGCVARIYNINTDEKIYAAASKNGYKVNLKRIRKTVFDCNLLRLTNKDEEIVAVALPTPRAVAAISAVEIEEDLEQVLAVLSLGRPAVIHPQKEIIGDGVISVKTYAHSSADMLCPQLIGYLDDNGSGVMGIEKAFDSLLSGPEISVLLPSGGNGELLLGGEAEITADTSLYGSGIALTIDSAIQSVTENAMRGVVSGAAVVSEVGTGKIRAMVSMPKFNPTNISEYLSAPNSPFINRALKNYNVGSVFKPCVAAALLEQGTLNGFSAECCGSTDIDSRTFHCHLSSGHGTVGIKTALEQSCNVFFYTVSQKLGGEVIYNMASRFMLSSAINLGGIYSDAGSLPNRDELIGSPRNVANLSIGQGRLLQSPVAMLALYEAIANGGVYHSPTVIEGEVVRGVLKQNGEVAPTVAFSRATADILKENLRGVLINGTGKAAAPTECTAAGKTATAQTGWRKQGRAVTNSWFCGFFPYENPKYVVVVMLDDLEKNPSAAAPLFAEIANGITLLENSKK